MILLAIMVAFGLPAFQGAGFVQCEKLHDILTDEEFSKVFRTARDNVPEYEVVPIMHDLYKRSSGNLQMQFNAFNRNVDIHLNPSDGILAGENTPVWLASAGSNGKVNYKKLKSNIVGSVAKSFVARRTLASFVVDVSTKKPGFHGTFDDLTIVPLPVRIQGMVKELFDRLKREVPKPRRTLIQTDYHVIIKTKASPRDSMQLEKQVSKIVQHFNETDDHRRKRFANDIIYPSILVATDYSGMPGTPDQRKIYDVIRYQLAFWNSVDLRFRDLESPKVRLRIAGIVIGIGRRATPYIYNFLKGENVYFNQSIRNMSTYWYNQTSNPDFKPGAYNVIISLTDCNLYDAKTQQAQTTGIAAIASLCRSRNRPEKFKAVGLVKDDMKFDGINTATHELGHILGALHDINTTGPCADSLGYIMAPQKLRTVKMHHWSSCSLDKIKYYLGRAYHCADQPAEIHRPGNPFERIAPGNILTAQQQCEAQGYSYACPPQPKMCEKLQCSSVVVKGIVPKQFCRNARDGALDGTLCASDAICIRGACQKGDQIIH